MAVSKLEQCARVVCERERTPEGNNRYCSAECHWISQVMLGTNGGHSAPALDAWSWLPKKPREVRVES